MFAHFRIVLSRFCNYLGRGILVEHDNARAQDRARVVTRASGTHLFLHRHEITSRFQAVIILLVLYPQISPQRHAALSLRGKIPFSLRVGPQEPRSHGWQTFNFGGSSSS